MKPRGGENQGSGSTVPWRAVGGLGVSWRTRMVSQETGDHLVCLIGLSSSSDC